MHDFINDLYWSLKWIFDMFMKVRNLITQLMVALQLFQIIEIILQVEMNFWPVHESKNSYDSIKGWIITNNLPA